MSDPSTVRAMLLGRAVSVESRLLAEAEWGRFERFREQLDVDDGPSSTALYATSCWSEDRSTARTRRRLQLLDLHRRLHGLQAVGTLRDLRQLVRGMSAHDPLLDGLGHYEPLYVHQVRALVDACAFPSADQLRVAAATLLRGAGVPVAHLARMTWDDLEFRSGRVDVRVTRRVGRGVPSSTVIRLLSGESEGACPVATLRALRRLDGGRFPFGVSGRPVEVDSLRRMMKRLEPGRTPAQVRDSALLVLGYGAGLRTNEAMTLRQADVRRHDQGLVLRIPGRRQPTYLPSATRPAYDPWAVWKDWLDELDRHDLRRPEALAFHATNFSVVFERGVGQQGLNRVVHQRAEQVGLRGRYVWTSLRTGMMRTALRANVEEFRVGHQAGLVTLGSVRRHERREHLLGPQAVAGRLGL